MNRIIIAGGGIMGASTAYFLKANGFEGEVICAERDTSFQKSSTTLSAASIRQQFSNKENIYLSQFALKCFEEWNLDINLKMNGYLYLASLEGKAQLIENLKTQHEAGAPIVKLSSSDLTHEFPEINLEGIALATWGKNCEGWFDAARLLDCVRAKAKNVGAILVKGIVSDVTYKDNFISSVKINGERVGCDALVAATGALSGKFMEKLGVNLPVEPRKRTVFVAKTPLETSHLPLIIDPSGLWLRPEGEFILFGGGEDSENESPAFDDFEPDYHLFEPLWEQAANRIPALENLKFVRAWAGHYDYNTLDQNAIIGKVTPFSNLFTLTGFSGHGLQQGLGAGRGLAELILTGSYKSLDLTCFSFDRILNNKPFFEKNII